MITRKAILIGAPNSPKAKSRLSGVTKDLSFMRSFLESHVGGNWYPEEILTLASPTTQEVQYYVAEASEDYVLIYFSGHGYTKISEKGRTGMVCLKNGDLEAEGLLSPYSSKQLLMVDSCRTFSQGIHGFDDDFVIPDIAYFTGSPTRYKFDEAIRDSPDGIKIIYSTKPGEVSYDTRRGGVFTQSLINCAFTLGGKFEYGQSISIEQTMVSTRKLMKANEEKQTPEISWSIGQLSVPFCYDINQEPLKTSIARPTNRRGDVRKPKETNWTGIALAVVLVLLILND